MAFKLLELLMSDDCHSGLIVHPLMAVRLDTRYFSRLELVFHHGGVREGETMLPCRPRNLGVFF